MKPYRLGILVGRFQTLHKGHEMMVEKALELCDRVGIFVGSSQESGTFKNPFSFDMRKEMLQAVFGSGIEVFPLPDIGIGNTVAWGNYVLENVKKQFGQLPDLLISGREERRVSWFDSPEGSGISELYVPKTVDISASRMREWFLLDDREAWKEYTNEKLHGRYDELREIVLGCADHLETQSL